jgi:recombination protein RecA
MAKKRDMVLDNFEGFEFGSEGNPTEFIPTGHAELDYIIASGLLSSNDEDIKTGGLPTGKLVMIYGGEGGGKSSLAYSICGAAQRMGKIPLWIDVENSFSESLAKINGVDLSRIGRKSMYDKKNPEKVFDGEYALDCVIEACKKGAGVVVLDSIASLVPRYVMENPADKDTMAALARLLGKSVNKICSHAAANNTLVIFINQLRVNPGAMFKDPEGFPGGKAIAHACSVILKMNKVNAKDAYTYIEDEEGKPKMVAGAANVFIQKNRFAAPHFGGIRIPIYYAPYFPQVEETAFEIGRQTKTISVRNGVFSWGGLKVEGKKAFISEVVAKNKVTELINDIVDAAKKNEKIILPASILNYDKHVAFLEQNKDKLEKGKQIASVAKKTKQQEIDEVLDTDGNSDVILEKDELLPTDNDL